VVIRPPPDPSRSAVCRGRPFLCDGRAPVLIESPAIHAMIPRHRDPAIPVLRHMNVLIMEDEKKIATAIRDCLASAGYHPTIAVSGDAGIFLLEKEKYDAIILDWMLPGRDGIEVLDWLRRRGTKPPVLLLTAKDAIEDRVKGLDSGADDYLVKPFAFPELLARLRALTRRLSTTEIFLLECAELRLDLNSRRAARGAEEISLTPREFDLLAFLLRHQGEIVSRGMIAQEVWRETNRSTPLDNVIDVHIARLRRKVDNGHASRLIHTVRGVGFFCGATNPLTAP
jgi:two-component system copper resistance phosphate regulon response regulator CusR